MGFMTKNNILIPFEIQIQTQTELRYLTYENKIEGY